MQVQCELIQNGLCGEQRELLVQKALSEACKGGKSFFICVWTALIKLLRELFLLINILLLNNYSFYHSSIYSCLFPCQLLCESFRGGLCFFISAPTTNQILLPSKRLVLCIRTNSFDSHSFDVPLISSSNSCLFWPWRKFSFWQVSAAVFTIFLINYSLLWS